MQLPYKIGYAARLHPSKNHNMILDIAAQRIDGVEFLLTGYGETQDALRSRIQSENLPVRLLGWINDINDFYNEIDLYINPSLYETFGLTIVEAMLHERPLLLIDTPLMREIAPMAYFFEGIEKACDLIRYLQKANPIEIDVTTRLRMAQGLMAERYTMSHCAREYTQLYEELCGR